MRNRAKRVKIFAPRPLRNDRLPCTCDVRGIPVQALTCQKQELQVYRLVRYRLVREELQVYQLCYHIIELFNNYNVFLNAIMVQNSSTIHTY
eukprot:COSAG02_NODE_9169_length_2304_cov_2.015420_1_plen_92_part_00